MIVESTLTCQPIDPVAPAKTCNIFTINHHTPPRCHRLNNP